MGKKGSRHMLGSRAHPIPMDVLSRFPPGAEQVAGEAAGWPDIFSYEMCCAGMVGELLPGLLPYASLQGENEAYSTSDPRFHLPVEKAISRKRSVTNQRLWLQGKAVRHPR